MLDREIVLEILRDACRAPSGDNAQPWRFQVRGNIIRVINVPEKDTSLFNYQQITNHVALGACIENLRISAEGRGFRVGIQVFPNPANLLIVAEATLTEDSSVYNDLLKHLALRASNRKRYLSKKINPQKLEELYSLAGGGMCRVSFISDDDEVRAMAHIVSAGERLALENKSIHDFLFGHVTWTRKEDEEKHGFFIDTFEFAPPQKFVFKLLSNWNVLRVLLPFGIADFIVRDMESVYATSGAFGAIIMSSRTPGDYVQSGMLLERLWITAQKLGLALQPTTTVHFIGTRVLAGDVGTLLPNQQELLRNRYALLAEKFGVSEAEGIGFVFRLGYAEAPSGRTTRFAPVVSLEDLASYETISRVK